jgi:AraC family transcriptional regulator
MTDYFEQLHRCVVFVESHLDEDIGFRDVASQAAYLSPWHFHRVFEAVLGLTVTEYIRERKLTAAAYRLVESDARIIDIALASGYESQEAFSRAFKRRFGTAPGAYRERRIHASIPARQPYSMEALRAMTGGIDMEPTIVWKDSFTIVGLEGHTSQANNRIPALWQAFVQREREVADPVPGNRCYGVCEYKDFRTMDENTEWTETVGLEAYGKKPLPKGMVKKTVPSMRYAVFSHKGSLDTLGETYDYIYKTYLPKSGLALAQADDFEYYDQRFNPGDPAHSEMFIYIPLAD